MEAAYPKHADSEWVCNNSDDNESNLNKAILQGDRNSDFQQAPHGFRVWLKIFFVSDIPVFLFVITARETITLIVWDSVVPSAAPAASSLQPPMKKKSRTILAAQVTAIKYIGLLESPMPRKIL